MSTPCNNAMLRRASRMLGQIYDDELAASGLKTTQYSLISQIDRMNEPTLRQLAMEIVMDLSALGHTLKPLIRDGYIALLPDAEDRRVKRVALTKLGKTKLRETRRLWSQAQKRFETVFGESRAAKLRQVLAELSSEDFRQSFNRSE